MEKIWIIEFKRILHNLYIFFLFVCLFLIVTLYIIVICLHHKRTNIFKNTVDQFVISWFQQFMNSTVHDSNRSWVQQFIISTVHDFSSSWSQQFMIAAVHDFNSSWSLQFMISAVHDCSSSWLQQFVVSTVHDCNSSWFQQFMSSSELSQNLFMISDELFVLLQLVGLAASWTDCNVLSKMLNCWILFICTFSSWDNLNISSVQDCNISSEVLSKFQHFIKLQEIATNCNKVQPLQLFVQPLHFSCTWLTRFVPWREKKKILFMYTWGIFASQVLLS